MKELIKSQPFRNVIFGNFNFFEKQSSMPKLVLGGGNKNSFPLGKFIGYIPGL